MSAQVLPYPISANAYWRAVRGIVIVSPEARAYKVHVGACLRVAGARPVDGPVSLTVDFYRPRRNGDLDNCLKVFLDALKGHLFHDDKQVVEIHARRFDDKANPRAEVIIRAAAGGQTAEVGTPC